MGRSEDELFEAAHAVGREWFKLAQAATDLSVIPGRGTARTRPPSRRSSSATVP